MGGYVVGMSLLDMYTLEVWIVGCIDTYCGCYSSFGFVYLDNYWCILNVCVWEMS